MKRRRPVLSVFAGLAVLPALYAIAVHFRWIPEHWVRFARPHLAWVPAVALAFCFVRLSSMRLRGVRTHLEDAFVGATALALSLAVIGVEIGRPLDRLTVIVAVDRSRSMELVPGAEEEENKQIALAQKHMRPDDKIAIVAFGATAVTEQPARTKDEPPLSQRAIVARDGTDLEAAIRRSLSEMPPDSAARIVLLTDGVGTRGDVMAGAAASLAAQVPVDTYVLTQEAVADVRVVSVRGPIRGNAGESVDLRVVTQSPKEAEVDVRVLLDGRLVREGKATIAEGEDVLRLREKLPDAGLHRYDVQITSPDASIDRTGEDNAGSTFVRVRGAAAALILEGDNGKSAFVAEALRKAEFRVDEGNAVDIPADLGGFVTYDLVVLSDIAASAFSTSQLSALASYVRDFGGGLLLLGGDRGLGPGGFGKTPVEEVSPVSFDLKQDQRRASLAEVIGIDISGSMGVQVAGKTKLELANEAASRSAELLGPTDRLGVAHVDTRVYWTVPIGPVDDKVGIDQKIRSMPVGGGGIMVPLTLTEAYAALSKETVNLKHLLLFSDGNDADDIEQAKTLVTQAFGAGITTSTIALGQGKDVAALEECAKLGGGRFYLIEDATRLPAVFAQETILAARSAIVEDPFRVAAGVLGQPGAGVDIDAAPELMGYVVTIPKPRATVHLLGPDSDPILATWSVGIGRSAAFTSDLKDRWGTEWTHWPGAARLLAQTARDIVRRDEDERVRLESSAEGGRLRVRATVLGDDGRADAFRRLHAKIAGPGGFSREIPLEPSASGTYTAELPLDRPGTYVVLARDEVSGGAVGTSGAVLSEGEEMRPTGSDPGLLARVSEFTAGKTREDLARVFLNRTTTRFAYDDITGTLTLSAALLLLCAVAARKLGMPEALAALAARLGRRRAINREAALATASARREPATVASLLQVKRSLGRPRPPPPKADRPADRPSPRVEPGLRPRPEPSKAQPAPPPPPPKELEKDEEDGTPPPPAAPGPTGKPLSTAELLLARRRAKK